MASLLQLNDITLVLDHNTVLRNFNFAVEGDEIHALLGTNGSGKSSLALMVMGCHGYTPTTGTITFDGTDVSQRAIHERARAGVSLAWQEPTRFKGLSVRDYLQLDNHWLPAEQCLADVGLDASIYLPRMLDRSLSGGERKRIELAAMLAMRPKLAILDEPAAGIDALSIETVANARWNRSSLAFSLADSP